MPVMAVSLGDIEPLSALGEPFRARIEFRLGPDESLDPSCVRLRSTVPGEDTHIPAMISALARVSVAAGRSYILLESTERSSEPILRLNVELTCFGMVAITRQYTLFPNPPQSSVPTPDISEASPVRSAPSAEPVRAAAPTSAPAVVRPADGAVPAASAQRHGTVPSGDRPTAGKRARRDVLRLRSAAVATEPAPTRNKIPCCFQLFRMSEELAERTGAPATEAERESLRREYSERMAQVDGAPRMAELHEDLRRLKHQVASLIAERDATQTRLGIEAQLYNERRYIWVVSGMLVAGLAAIIAWIFSRRRAPQPFESQKLFDTAARTPGSRTGLARWPRLGRSESADLEHADTHPPLPESRAANSPRIDVRESNDAGLAVNAPHSHAAKPAAHVANSPPVSRPARPAETRAAESIDYEPREASRGLSAASPGLVPAEHAPATTSVRSPSIDESPRPEIAAPLAFATFELPGENPEPLRTSTDVEPITEHFEPPEMFSLDEPSDVQASASTPPWGLRLDINLDEAIVPAGPPAETASGEIQETNSSRASQAVEAFPDVILGERLGPPKRRSASPLRTGAAPSGASHLGSGPSDGEPLAFESAQRERAALFPEITSGNIDLADFTTVIEGARIMYEDDLDTSRAVGLIQLALSADQLCVELWLGLFEIYARENLRGAFSDLATNFLDRFSNTEARWPAIAMLGRKLDPDNKLFSPEGLPPIEDDEPNWLGTQRHLMIYTVPSARGKEASPGS